MFVGLVVVCRVLSSVCVRSSVPARRELVEIVLFLKSCVELVEFLPVSKKLCLAIDQNT